MGDIKAKCLYARNTIIQVPRLFINKTRAELPCHSRLLLPVDRGTERKEYHNSSVRGQDEVLINAVCPE